MPWRIKELRHYSYQQHALKGQKLLAQGVLLASIALGYELLGLQGVLEPYAKLLLPIKH